MRKIPAPYTDPAYLFQHGGAAHPGVLDFSVNVNPLGPPRSVLSALREHLSSIAHYPDPDCRELTALIAKLHGLDPSQIVVGNGSNELIYAIARAFRPKRAAIAEPTYTEYLRASLSVGAKVDHWLAEGKDFKLTPFDPENAKLVWLCNPNNPTGGMWAGVDYLRRWMTANSQCVFVMDEAFQPFCLRDLRLLRGFPSTLLTELDRIPNAIVLRSLTKVFALPGLRLGFLVTAPRLAERIRNQLPPWTVNSLALIAGLTALQDRSYEQETRIWLMDQMSLFRSGSFFPLPSQTSFTLVRLTGMVAPDLVRRLMERGIVIRDASNFVGLDENYVRIAFRTKPDNDRLMKEIASILES